MKSIFKLGTIILAASLAFAGKPKIAKDLRGVDPNSNVDVIVQFNQTLQEKHIDKMKKKGGCEKARHAVINAATFTLSAKALAELEHDPDVAYVTPDRYVSGSLDYAEPAINSNIALSQGYDGKGVGIALVDSGITNTADL